MQSLFQRVGAVSIFLAVAAAVITPVSKADDPITTIDVVKPAGTGFTIDTDVSDNMLKNWITNTDGTVIMFERDTTATVPWTVQVQRSGDDDIYSCTAGSAVHAQLKTCCWMVVHNDYHFSIPDKDCYPWGGGCTAVEEHCTDGWVNCPAGTHEQIPAN